MSALPQKIKIYLSADTVLKIDINRILSFPVDKIVQVQKEETNVVLTALCIISVFAVIVFIFEAINFSISGIDMSI